jgi:tetratricopeptide (TPR) repeat protein
VRVEGCPATVSNGEVVEVKKALVDSSEDEDLPHFYRRGTFESGKLLAPESSLEKGLRLFERGQFPAAASAFEEAASEVDPLSSYDEVDLRYNRARCLQELGKVREALALFESIGDVVYLSLVDEQIESLESGGRR